MTAPREHVIGCITAARKNGGICTCADVRADAERRRIAFARDTPLRPINGHMWRPWR